MHPLDEATTLQAVGVKSFTGRTSEAYWNFASPFGVITAGALLRAVLEQGARLGDPCAPTTNFTARRRQYFCHRFAGGQGWTLGAALVAELAQSDVIAANATIACARREDTWRYHPVTRPAAPPPDRLEPMPAVVPNAVLRQFEFASPQARPNSARASTADSATFVLAFGSITPYPGHRTSSPWRSSATSSLAASSNVQRDGHSGLDRVADCVFPRGRRRSRGARIRAAARSR